MLGLRVADKGNVMIKIVNTGRTGRFRDGVEHIVGLTVNEWTVYAICGILLGYTTFTNSHCCRNT